MIIYRCLFKAFIWTLTFTRNVMLCYVKNEVSIIIIKHNNCLSCKGILFYFSKIHILASLKQELLRMNVRLSDNQSFMVLNCEKLLSVNGNVK
jgi:hypothetical protein